MHRVCRSILSVFICPPTSNMIFFGIFCIIEKPLQLTIAFTPLARQHLKHGVPLMRAYYTLTKPPQTYQAIWERVNRRKKLAAAAATSPMPQAISTTDLSPMSDLTASTKASSSKKRTVGKSDAAVTKRPNRIK